MISDVAKVGLEGLNHLARFNCGDPEGQYRCGASMPAFDLPDLDAQRLKGGWGRIAKGVLNGHKQREGHAPYLSSTGEWGVNPIRTDGALPSRWRRSNLQLADH
jgi:hypothetical protein